MDAAVGDAPVQRQFAVRGMTCPACRRRIHKALASVPGVQAVTVGLVPALAAVRYDPARLGDEAVLARAAAAAGYELVEPVAGEPAAVPAEIPLGRPVFFGLVGIAGLLLFYLAIITLAQDWRHAVQQLAEDRWFVAAIAVGFGTQIGLYNFLRRLHAHVHAGGMAASTGTSTTAMLACCAHHLTDVLPVLGLSGAAVFLNAYKHPILWVSITMNLAGIIYLVIQIRRHRLNYCPS